MTTMDADRGDRERERDGPRGRVAPERSRDQRRDGVALEIEVRVGRSGHEADRVEEVARAGDRDRPSSTTTPLRRRAAASIRHCRATISDRGHQPDELRLEQEGTSSKPGEHRAATVERLDGERRREQHEPVRLTEEDPGPGFEREHRDEHQADRPAGLPSRGATRLVRIVADSAIATDVRCATNTSVPVWSGSTASGWTSHAISAGLTNGTGKVALLAGVYPSNCAWAAARRIAQ